MAFAGGGEAVVVEVIIVTCEACGPMQVAADRFEVHADRDQRIALYAWPCPRCGEVGVGGCRELIAHLLELGVRRRELRDVAAAPITAGEVTAFRRWLESDPVWDLGTC
jgi:hypothetical protein